MATTAAQVGATLLAGFRTHTNDWNATNTGAALTTTDALEIRPEGIPHMEAEYAPNLGVYGGVGMQRIGLSVATYKCMGPIKINGLFSCHALARLIACWFGAEETTLLGSGAYSHVLTIAANSPYVGNFAYRENQLCHDIPMTKVDEVDFEWEPGQIPTVTVTINGKRELVDGSGLNTFAGMTTSAITFPTQPAILYPILAPSTCTVRFNTASGGLLTASDVPVQGVTKISLSFKRKPEMVYSNLNTPYPDEPIYGPDFEVSGTLGFSRQAAVAEWNRLIGQTETKLDIAFTGTTIGGGYTYKWLFEFPSIIPQSSGAPSVSARGVLSYDLQFSAYEALANPSGMAFVRPRMTIVDIATANHVTNET